MRIIFATKNKGKLKEIKEVLHPPFDVLSMEEVGITDEVVEDQGTYEGNALKKAKEICRRSQAITLADDSGLEIDCLGKKPGVDTALYMGKDTPYSERISDILGRTKDIPTEQRTARFVCVIAAAFPDGTTHFVRREIEGLVALEAGTGKYGFAFDPIFFLPDYGKTMCEIPLELKNEISHRGQALRAMKEYLSAKRGG